MDKDDKLQILKDILLTDERTYALKIEEKLKVLEDTLNKKQQLTEKLNPILEEKFNVFISEIPQTLGPTITEALKTEIKNSKDEVVEALYPIMGKMIKRYVQNEIQILSENINKKVSKTFSFDFFKRKIKAKTSGIKESDLIIQEHFKPIIEQVLVIENFSGIIKNNFSITKNIDKDTVSGLLTAIKGFAEDAFNTDNQKLNYIEYDTFHIHLQNFSNYYIAVVISGTYNVIYKNELEDKLLNFAENFINNNITDNTKITNYFSTNAK